MKVVIDGKNYVPEAKEEKPEIRFGDYGICTNESGHLLGYSVSKNFSSGKLTVNYSGGTWSGLKCLRCYSPVCVGNIDDLAGEDLDRFEVETGYSRELHFSFCDADIYCKVFSSGFTEAKHIRLPVEKAKEIINGIQRQILTLAKRKCKDGDC